MMGYEAGKKIYQGKQILVLGLAKSGVAAAKLLHRFGAHVAVNDRKPENECEGVEELRRLGIEVVCGDHPEYLLHPGLDYVVKNPGIPYSAKPVKRALALEIPVITEVEIAYRISSAPLIGITGSNGKTTTTTLVGEMLRASGLAPRVAGNIGTVLCEEAALAREDEWLVAELSSFQLAGTERFAPKIAALLNLFPAHLDYHGTVEAYLRAKCNIFRRQTSADVAVLNADSPVSGEIAAEIPAGIWWFSREREVARGTMLKGGALVYRDERGKEHVIIARDEIALPGEHNLENALAAALIALAAGADIAAIRRTLRTFRGVEHRLEYVDTIDGVRYYNDSKATNPGAAIKALQSFREPIVYIAGGLDRGIDFRELQPFFASGKVKSLIAYGQSSEKLQKVAREAGLSRIYPVDNVKEAVFVARDVAEPGDVVLLSPACASWDLYASFEERGRIFKETVHNLKTSRP
ncbi:UDP-N-acetylmuramoyl-L-alanine--D-glutamate ligase [Bacillaceae bacterium]